MKTLNILLAGFGGQGVLFAGKAIAYAGLTEDREISWLPSYGPEMRGGTCNCSVVISDQPIGSPLVINPDVLVAMNLPSLDKFENAVVEGGLIITDSTIVNREPVRTDVRSMCVPASQLAEQNGLKGLANIILVGKLLAATGFCSQEAIEKGIKKCVSAKHADLLEKNLQAARLGMKV